jgi:hypothetical protein
MTADFEFTDKPQAMYKADETGFPLKKKPLKKK